MPKNRQHNLMITQLFLISSLLITGAQTQAATLWYQVEMIVFKQNHSATTVKEPLPENSILPDPSTAIPLNHTGNPGKRLGSSVAFKLLGRNQLSMKDYYNRLSASRVYQPVAHIAWRQPVPYSRHGQKLQLRFGGLISGSTNDNSQGFPDNRADIKPVTVSSNNSQLNEFSGTLAISRLRYLHFNVDLAYHPKRSANNKTFRMREIRRMRSKVVHLLDHPMFGIIVYMTPLKK